MWATSALLKQKLIVHYYTPLKLPTPNQALRQLDEDMTRCNGVMSIDGSVHPSFRAVAQERLQFLEIEDSRKSELPSVEEMQNNIAARAIFHGNNL